MQKNHQDPQEEIRYFDNNLSYIQGRQTELFVINKLEMSGYNVVEFKKNQKYADYVVIDHKNNQEFLLQIKSSKNKIPYITCAKKNGLLQMAKQLNMIPLICLYFTTPKKMTFINLETNHILFSTNPLFIQNTISDFKCYNKEK